MAAVRLEEISRRHPLPLLGLLLGILLLYRIGLVLHRIYFHPLSKFPGPKTNAASNLPYLYGDKITGRFVKGMTALHAQYGPIVRIGPNRLAIDGSVAWKDVFGHRPAGHPEFGKVPLFYGKVDPSAPSIFQTNREDHRRQRRLLSHAFSEAAIHDQEPIIKQYVDLLMLRLRELAEKKEALDIVRWFNYATFDIIGDLAFGESFNSLQDSTYHPWVSIIFDSIRAGSRQQFLNYYPLLRPIVFLLVGKEGFRKRAENEALADAKTEKRLAMGPAADGRKDFMTYILRNNGDGKGMSHREILQNSRGLIVAGSETTATAMSGLVYFLSQSSKPYKRLTEEIRHTFDSEDEITIKSAAQLPYLHACLEETMRMYPPAAETPPRVSPGDLVGGEYIPKGTIISVFQWATYRSATNFHEPDRFAPERWLEVGDPDYDIRFASDDRASLKPFAYGTRDCIGKNLAYSEMRLIVARLLWNFEIELVKGYENWVNGQNVFTIHEKGPLEIKLSPVRRG